MADRVDRKNTREPSETRAARGCGGADATPPLGRDAVLDPADRSPEERSIPVFTETAAGRRTPGSADHAWLDTEREVAEFLPHPYMVTGTDGTIVMANHAACELIGQPVQQLLGEAMTAVIAFEHGELFSSMLASIVHANRRERRRALIRSADGDHAAVVTAAVASDRRGASAGVRWLIEPVTAETDRTVRSRTFRDGLPHSEVAGRSAVPELAAEMNGMLSEVAGVLAGSSDYLDAVRSALQLALPWLGDWAILDLVGEGTAVRRAGVARVPDEDRETARTLWRRPPSLSDANDPIARVLCGGEPTLIEDVGDEARARLGSTAWGRDFVDRLAPRSWISVPLLARGRTIGALTFITATSGRRLGREHLDVAQRFAQRAALAADNARLHQEAARASESKSAFLAVMSHELRTPLTAIMGYTELLSDGLFGAVTEQQQVQLGRVRESSEHLLGIVEQVLHYARLEGGQEEPAIADVEIPLVVDQAMALIRPLAERKRIALELRRSPGEASVRTDPYLLRQVLVNLLANAVRFTDAGEVSLVVRETARRVSFEVRDTGLGIPEGQLNRIFEPFWQGDQRFTRAQPGSGLGLSVTKELVELLGGGIDVRSTVGKGSAFTVWIPRRGPDGHAGARRTASAHISG